MEEWCSRTPPGPARDGCSGRDPHPQGLPWAPSVRLRASMGLRAGALPLGLPASGFFSAHSSGKRAQSAVRGGAGPGPPMSGDRLGECLGRQATALGEDLGGPWGPKKKGSLNSRACSRQPLPRDHEEEVWARGSRPQLMRPRTRRPLTDQANTNKNQ